jgi:F-type H+-transporting ATPase subunit b
MLRKTGSTLAVATVLALGLLTPATRVLAEDEHAAEAHDGAAEAAHGGHGGPLTLEGILHGEERYSFFAAFLNFALLILVLRKLGKQPLAKFLDKRRDDLEQGIKEASEAKLLAEAKYREYAERLERLDDELKKLRSDIETAANAERERILAEAQASATRADADTRALIELQAKQLGADVRREMVASAIEGAREALNSALRPDDQQRIADGYVKAMADIKQEKRA